VRRVARNSLPVISSQGIFQISTLVDISLATLVGTSAMSALGYSQRLIYLPISLFGVSVAAGDSGQDWPTASSGFCSSCCQRLPS
jgi:peptidoglycan biosynthesis protein MviN/MurJ (putative lipid II flippase)